MGYQQDGYATQAQFYVRELGPWVQGDVIARAVLAPLVADGLLARCAYLAENLADPSPITSVDAVLARSQRWKYDVIELMSAPEQADAELYIHLAIEPDGLRVLVGLGGSVLDSYRSSVLEMSKRWVLAWSAGATSLRLAIGSLDPLAIDYPRPSPPRTSARYLFGSLQQYLGVSWHRSRAETDELLRRILEAPLPAYARRSIEADVVVISFLDRIADPTHIAAARLAHEQWLSPLANAQPERGWNEHGDRIVIPRAPEPHPPLTLYDPQDRIGYKAIVVQADGTVDEEVWAALVAIIAARELPDGTPVNQIRLIVPVRDNALAIAVRAGAEGFEMVTYPGQPGVFWQVLPGR